MQGRAEDGVLLVRGLTPDRQAADGNTVFGWRPLPGAKVYRLQVFALAPAQASLPASREQAAGAEPEFVTGVLLDGSTNETQLSELVQGKLEAGRRYLWRVTAHDEAGRTIGQSEDASFVFR